MQLTRFQSIFLIGILALVIAAAIAAILARQSPVESPSGPPPIGAMAIIAKGVFLMGSDEVVTEQFGSEFGSPKPWFLDEHPLHRVHVRNYGIDYYEVTNQQYAEFVRSTQAPPPPTWPGGTYPPEQARWPVTGVTWFEADNYCRWAGKRLPTEAEWEKAARGTQGRIFPWGDTFDEKKGNIGTTSLAPVGSYPEGRSPYGVYDMAGNAAEWVADWYQAYPGTTHTSPAFGEKFKVVRNSSFGGSAGHYTISHFYRTSYRFFHPPDQRFRDLGFRCAK